MDAARARITELAITFSPPSPHKCQTLLPHSSQPPIHPSSPIPPYPPSSPIFSAQLRSVTAIYWYFTVADVIYDVTRPDRLAVRGTLCVRPWLAPLTTRQLHMVAVLRLEPHEERVTSDDDSDVPAAPSRPGGAATAGGIGSGSGSVRGRGKGDVNVSGGGGGGGRRVVCRIAEQSNFFEVDPLVAELPLIGALYAWSARLALLPAVLSHAVTAGNAVYRLGLPGIWVASAVLSGVRQAVTSILHVVFWVPKGR
ncbi:unnamed protein product [Closterium sp. Naga37s-1]|nr:unnamed protein product [Closterium sp. Naga37s-1]